MKRTFLVTGANRGLGLEFVRQLLTKGETVFAAVRNVAHASELKKLLRSQRQNLCMLPVDVADDKSVAGIAEHLHFVSIDVLINNAGVFPDQEIGFEKLEADLVLKTINVNAVGPFRIVKTCLPMLRAGTNPIVANVSSGLGSISRANGRNMLAYRMSKAALNMASRALADALHPYGVTSVSLDPGWARTDMGGPQAPLSPEESVAGMLNVIYSLSPKDAGRFIDRRGEDVPW